MQKKSSRDLIQAARSMRSVRRTAKIHFTLLLVTIFTTSVILLVTHVNYLIPFNTWQNRVELQTSLLSINSESFNLTVTQDPSASEESLPHRTYLLSRKRCTQKLFLLILVFTAPANFDRRNIIRKTWASDPSMQIRWKTMFLLGQPTGDGTLNEYLKAEGLIFNDFIQGAQRENCSNLTLKTEMGLEWAAKYCDFKFILKADDDVFVNPYRLVDFLSNPDTPGTELYLGFVMYDQSPHRSGKYGVSVEEYNKTRYPDFCSGPAYVLSWDLVHKLVDLFDVKNPLKLEDVYIATLLAKLGVKAVRHHGFHSLEFGPCKHYSDTVVYHRASIQCMEELFSKSMQERVEHKLTKLKSVKTEKAAQSSMLARNHTEKF